MLLNMIIIVLLYVVIVRLYEIRAFAQIPLEATQKADDLSIGLRNMTIMHIAIPLQLQYLKVTFNYGY